MTQKEMLSQVGDIWVLIDFKAPWHRAHKYNTSSTAVTLCQRSFRLRDPMLHTEIQLPLGEVSLCIDCINAVYHRKHDKQVTVNSHPKKKSKKRGTHGRISI